MSKFWNSVWNTIAVPIRWLGTGASSWLDVVKTWCNVVTDIWNVVKDTSDKVWEVLTSSWNKWKWYNKLYQVPTGVLVSWAVVVEWAVRTALEPAWNLILNVRDGVGNFFNNIWNTIKRTFDTTRPTTDFSYEKLKMKAPSYKNWLSKLARWKN